MTVLSLSAGAILGSCVLAAPAGAATAVSESMLFFETNSSSATQLWAGPMSAGAAGLAPVGSPRSFVLYAIAADPTSGVLYGFARTAGTDDAGDPVEIGDLIKVDTSDGTTTNLGPIADLGVTGAGTNPWAATFGPDGTLYVFGPNPGAIFAVNVEERTARAIELSGTLSAGDLAWSKGYLWAIPTSASAVIERIDPATGDVVSTLGPAEISAGPVSAIATLANGNLLASVGNTVPSTAVEIQINNAASTTPSYTVISSTSVNARFNDGASISTVADPTVNPATGSGRMSGTGTPGDTIVITDSDGKQIGTTTVATDGSWSAEVSPALTSGGTVTVTNINPAGSTAQITATTTIPAAPDGVTSNGSTASGKGTPGATVTVTDPNTGDVIGTGTVAADGTFSVAVSPALADGDTARVTLTDADGNVSDPTTVTADTVAPDAPGRVNSSTTTVSGSAEPGSSVTVTDKDGNVLGTATVGDDGAFTVALSPEQSEGAQLTVTATDEAGNESDPTTVTVDATAPSAPDAAKTAANGSTAKGDPGAAEPGSTITITDEDGNVLGTGTANDDGSFEVALSPKQSDGAEIKVTATDAAGNESDPTTLTVDDKAPSAPEVGKTGSDGSAVTGGPGAAEPGSTITVTDKDGNVLGTGTADEDGSFEVTLSPEQRDGAQVNVTVTDEAGNTSGSTTVTVDTTAPSAPNAGRTSANASAAAGKAGAAEPGAIITVTDEDGNVLGTGTANADGSFDVTLSPQQSDGARVKVTATDKAGNTSEPTTVTVDAAAPSAPAADKTTANGARATGKAGAAEPGSTITVTDADGNVVGTGTAGADGSFSIALSPKQADGARLSVAAADGAGNTSPGTPVTVDATAPSAPAADKTTANANSVNGKPGAAEPGSTITITDPATGAVLGTGTAGPDGSFTVSVSPALKDGAKVGVTSTDKAGNVSGATTVTVDAVAPSAPSITTGDGNTVSGTGEPGSTIVITDQDGNVIGTALVGPNGTWTAELSPAQKPGAIIGLSAVDPSGNVSKTAVFQYEGDEGGYGPAADDDAAKNGQRAARGMSVQTGGSLADVSDVRGDNGWWAALLAALGIGAAGAAVGARRIRRRRA